MTAHIILVVEDDDFQRRQMVRLLKADGYDVLQASDGDEAVRILDQQSLSLVLTDRRMPGINGDSLLEYIRTNHSRIPVIVVTAYPEGMEKLTPDALLIKPFTLNQLREQVQRLTQQESA